MSGGRRFGTVVAGVLLMSFGFLAIFSIGLPVLVAGLLVFIAGVTGAHRSHPDVFWPVAAGTAVFFIGYVLVAPLTCTARGVANTGNDAGDGQTIETTTCTNLLGIDYSGGAGYNPPLWPATATGAAAAVIAGMATRRLLANHEED